MTKIDRIFWGIALVALPFVFSGGFEDEVRQPKAAFFGVLVGLAICYRLGRRVSWALGCAATLPYIWTIFFSSGFRAFDLFVFSAVLFSGLSLAEARKEDIEKGLEALELAGLLCAAYAVLQYANIDPLNHFIEGADNKRVMVFFGQHTLYGPFAVAALAPALFRRRFLRAAFLAWPIFAIDSSFTYLSLGAVVALYLTWEFGEKAVFAILVTSFLAGSVLIYEYQDDRYVHHDALNDNGRFPLWRVTWRIARARPLLGHGGLGSFSDQFRVFQSPDLRRKMGIDESKFSPEAKEVMKQAEQLHDSSGWFLSPHNEFLDAFYEFGAAGLFFALFLPVVFLFWWLTNPPDLSNWIFGAIFFSIMANAIGNFTLHLIPQALLAFWSYVLVATGRDRGILES